MEEKNDFSVDTEQLKNETKNTVDQVREQIKNTDFKKDAEATKGFVIEMFSNPFEAIRKVASEEENVLPKVVILMIIYIAASVAYQIISTMKYGFNFMYLVASVLHPILFIAAPAILVLILNRKNKKSLITIISTLVVTSIPVIVTELISIINILVGGLSTITSPISTMLSAVAIVLTYFGMKDLFGEEDNSKFIKTYAIIKLLAAFILLILGRIGIY